VNLTPFPPVSEPDPVFLKVSDGLCSASMQHPFWQLNNSPIASRKKVNLTPFLV
jgi:hypothetical protein